MGMQSSSLYPGVDAALADLGIHFEKTLGAARFLKTVLGKDRYGELVVKIFLKPLDQRSYQGYIQKIQQESAVLVNIPGALCYSCVAETEGAIVGCRDFATYSLYDRLSTRPYLEEIEKQWICFQLLKCLQATHQRKIYHGDIKAENVLLTSGLWTLLADFGSFKPSFLREDDPSEFSYFFESSVRPVCYLAPERFVSETFEADLTEAMDMFSLGCVIAELFLDGQALFSLADVMEYKSGQMQRTENTLSLIENSSIRAMVKEMIAINPEDRPSAEDCLSKYRNQSFPEQFYGGFYKFIVSLQDFESFWMVGDKCTNYAECIIMSLQDRLPSFQIDSITVTAKTESISDQATSNELADKQKLVNPRKISRSNVPNFQSLMLIVFDVISCHIRKLVSTTWKLAAIKLIVRCSSSLLDRNKLDNVLPYLFHFIKDQDPIVRSAALQALSHEIQSINELERINFSLFPDYIIPQISTLAEDSSRFVRASLALHLPYFASSAYKFLNVSSLAICMDEATASLHHSQRHELTSHFKNLSIRTECIFVQEHEFSYDTELRDLRNAFREIMVTLLSKANEDPELLNQTLTHMSLYFDLFGLDSIIETILGFLITFMNHQNWYIRFQSLKLIQDIHLRIGNLNMERYLLPVVIQALFDHVEFISEAAINVFRSLLKRRIFCDVSIAQICMRTSPLLLHPNVRIRSACIKLFINAFDVLDELQIQCFVVPYLAISFVKPLEVFMSYKEYQIPLSLLRPPLSRPNFEIARQWAWSSHGKGLWAVQNTKITEEFSSYFQEPPGQPLNIFSGVMRRLTQRLKSVAISNKDRFWLSRLQRNGFDVDQQVAFTALRYFCMESVRHSQNTETRRKYAKPFPMQDLRELGMRKFDQTRNEISFSRPKFQQQIRRHKHLISPSVSGKPVAESPEGDKTSLSAMSSTKTGLEVVTESVNTAHPGHERTRYRSLDSSLSLAAASSLKAAQKSLERRSPSKLINRSPDSPANKALQMDISRRTDNIKTTTATSTRAYAKYKGIGTASTLLGSLLQSIETNSTSITRLKLSTDQYFAISSSTSGDVFIWSTDSFFTEAQAKPALAWRHPRASHIVDINFVGMDGLVVVAADDGSVTLLHIEYEGMRELKARFLYVAVDYEWTLPSSISVCCCYTDSTGKALVGSGSIANEHIEQDNVKLVVACRSSELYLLHRDEHGIELFGSVSVSFGMITTITASSDGIWLVIGTAHGFVQLWDARTHIAVREWQIGDLAGISRLAWRTNRSILVFAMNKRGSAEIQEWDLPTSTQQLVIKPTGGSKLNRYDRSFERDDDHVPSEEVDEGNPNVNANNNNYMATVAFDAFGPVVGDICTLEDGEYLWIAHDKKACFWRLDAPLEASDFIVGLPEQMLNGVDDSLQQQKSPLMSSRQRELAITAVKKQMQQTQSRMTQIRDIAVILTEERSAAVLADCNGRIHVVRL